MSGTAREVAGGGVISPGDRAVRDTVAVDVAVPRPLAGEALEVVLREHLAAVELPFRVLELWRHPEVHPEVQVGKDEHRRLEAVGVIEGVAGHLVALLDRSR